MAGVAADADREVTAGDDVAVVGDNIDNSREITTIGFFCMRWQR